MSILAGPMGHYQLRTLGVILAGGESRRFGADKRAALLGGRPLLAWVADGARPQVELLLLNANDPGIDQERQNLERLPDQAPGEGPLAGILAALAEAERRGFTHVATFSCDTPFFPRDTVVRLEAALRSPAADFAVARCGAKAHFAFALWRCTCLAALADAFARGTRSLGETGAGLARVWADFPPEGGPGGDPFFNINRPADLKAAETWIERQNVGRL